MNPLSLHCSQINEVENRFLEIFCWLIWCQVGSGYSCDQNTASAPNILEESSGKHYKKTYYATGMYILPAFCFDHFFGNDLSIFSTSTSCVTEKKMFCSKILCVLKKYFVSENYCVAEKCST